MSRIRVFVSYDEHHDGDLRDLLDAQSRRAGSTFALVSETEGGTMSEAWEASSRRRIRAVDEVVVICGEHTDSSPRIAAEVRIAQEEHKPYLLVWGRRDRMCTRPEGALRGDAMYSWSREILESQMAVTLRHAKPLEVPESCKRRQG
jgi:hypothetical protein